MNQLKAFYKVTVKPVAFLGYVSNKTFVDQGGLRSLYFIFFHNFSFFHGKIILLLLDFNNIMSNLLIYNSLINGREHGKQSGSTIR